MSWHLEWRAQAPRLAALYNAPTTFTAAAAAGHYGQADMQTLFNLYSADRVRRPSAQDGDYSSALPGYTRANPRQPRGPSTARITWNSASPAKA